MKWIKQRYARKKAEREFRSKRLSLSNGMSADAVRELLGEPNQINSWEEESDLYIEWRYVGAVGKNKDYVLLFNADYKLISWYTKLEDGTAVLEAKVRMWWDSA